MSSEQELLAKIRTLLALERNYLAEERTALAEFRTGLTIALVSPPAVSLLHYALEGLPNLNLIGIWISIRSRLNLKKIRQKIQLLKDRQLTVIKDSDELCSLLEDCIS
jgi:uncharacterized membrane protein YidH (DUF202 family)